MMDWIPEILRYQPRIGRIHQGQGCLLSKPSLCRKKKPQLYGLSTTIDIDKEGKEIWELFSKNLRHVTPLIVRYEYWALGVGATRVIVQMRQSFRSWVSREREKTWDRLL